MNDKDISIISFSHHTRRAAVKVALLLLLIFMLLQSACLPFNIPIKSSTIIDPSFTERITNSDETTDLSDTLPASEVTSATTAAAETFAVKTTRLILEGLQAKSKSISISDAIEQNTILEADVQSTIDLVFKLYRNVFCLHPEYFYLNGSINVSYSVSGQDGDLESMTVKPEYWPAMADLSSAELNTMTGQINEQVDGIAASVRQQTTVPWQQLQLIHDKLIQSIAYDQTLDQANNQAYSALIDKSTMCQGYAQAFQLIGQRLGFEIVLALGNAEGIGHAWDIVNLDGKYYHVDVTFDDPTPDGGAAAPVQHIHFLRSDSVMQKSHQWTAADFPACPVDGAQYYSEKNLTAGSQTALKKELRQFIQAIDFSGTKPSLFEVLFTGKDLPNDTGLEEMVRSILSAEASQYSVLFSHQVSKKVIVVEITPDN